MAPRPDETTGIAEGRRGVHEAAAAPVSDFRVLLGQAYVSPDAARGPLSVLDPDRARTLTGWIDELIPGNEHWPSASATDAVGYIDATAFRVPAIRPALLRGIDTLAERALTQFGVAFDQIDRDHRPELVAQLEAENPEGVFELVLELTYEAYYRSEHVIDVLERRTGFSTRRAMEGWAMDPFDERLLERVRSLPPRGRSVPR